MQLAPIKNLKDIASLLNAEYKGANCHIIAGINEIHRVQEGDLTFVDHPKYYRKAIESKATTIIINDKNQILPEGKAFIFSEDPLKDFIFLCSYFKPFRQSYEMISSSAEIGEGTIIQPGVFIGNNVKIGTNCIINANVSIYDNTIIGNDVCIQSGTVIGGDAFYFQKRKEGFVKLHSCGRVIIEDKVDIGACCTIDRGVTSDTIIGQDTKLDNHIQIGHDTIIGKRCLFASQVGISGTVIVEDDVILWGQVGVQKDLTIGAGAVVLGQSGIPKSIEGGKVYFGSPVQEARAKMKELALIKQLPYLLRRLQNSHPSKNIIENLI